MIEGKRKSLIHNSLGGQWKRQRDWYKTYIFFLNYIISCKNIKVKFMFIPDNSSDIKPNGGNTKKCTIYQKLMQN